MKTDVEQLLKQAEISLRNAPAGTVVSEYPIQIRDGKIFHPSLNEDGTLKKKNKKALFKR